MSMVSTLANDWPLSWRMNEMVGMIGRSSGHMDSLTGLLQIIKNPAAVEGHIAKIKEAEETHQASLKTAREEIIKARKELQDQKTKQDLRENVLNEKETALKTKAVQLSTDELALNEKKERFAEFETKTSANLSERSTQIMKIEANQKANQQKLNQKEHELALREQIVSDRERAVKIAENEHLARAAKLREALA